MEHSRIYRENGKNCPCYGKNNEQPKYFYEQNVFEKPIHISKLRNILTEAISNVTKEKTLRKGESVELTLEVQLLKTEINTPRNSLVEVTILQHNKGDYKDKRKPIQINANKIKYKDEIKRLSSESVTVKRKNRLFRKVEIKPTTENKSDSTEEEIIYFDDSNKFTKTDCTHRENFVTVLPNELFKNGNFKNGYSTTTQKENDSKIFSKCPKPRHTTTITTTDNSLVKKLSNLFLPNKKEQFTEDKAIKGLNYELNNIKHKSKKHVGVTTSKEEKKVHVSNLNNQINNIHMGMIEYSDNEEEQSEQHKSYFEHTTIKNKKHTQISKNTKAIKNITTSYSDTCIEYHIGKNVYLGPNNTNLINNFTVNQSHEKATNFINNNMEEISQNYNKKIKLKKMFEQSQTTNGRGDAIDHCKQSQNKLLRHNEQSKPINKKKSTIYWNGKTIEINKQIKKKIELLVLNELQNVALKEGMECEVTPLPSTEDSMNSINKVEKMSSYMCELDIRDAKTRKSTKKRKLKDRKYKTKHDRQRTSKFKQIKSISVTESNNTDQPTIQCLDNGDSELFKSNVFEVNHCEMHSKERSLGLNNKTQEIRQYAEIKYLKYSSSESCNARLISAFESKTKVKPANNVIGERQNHSNERFFAKGFVKKIASDDSTWYAFLSGKNLSVEKSRECKSKIYSNNNVEYSSVTSKECENKVEIELTTQDLQFLLKEARDKHKASKIFIYKDCNNCVNGKYKKSKRFTGKNSNSYTKLLLTKASKKLEKYAK